MALIVLDRDEQREMIRDRRKRGLDRFDEVWEGVYVMSPLADSMHQGISTQLSAAFIQALSKWGKAQVFAGLNVSDRSEKWKKNYRCPDVAVYLPGNPGKDMGAYWYGGPDFTVEVVSPYDRSRKKLDFYAKVGVRELLLIDRKPWSLELYRLTDGELKLAGKIKPDDETSIKSQVLPVSFRLLPADPRPTIEVTQTDDARTWLI